MGIDRIGKGSAPPGGPTSPTSPKGATPSERVRGPEPSRPFEVHAEKSAEASRAGQAGQAGQVGQVGQVAPVAASPLERLRAGQIDVNGYLDLKVEQATAHLRGLPPAELGAVKSMLREQIASDPALADLVKQATGSAPPIRGDE